MSRSEFLNQERLALCVPQRYRFWTGVAASVPRETMLAILLRSGTGGHLWVRLISSELEEKITVSMENKHLLQCSP
jgi:dUTPase